MATFDNLSETEQTGVCRQIGAEWATVGAAFLPEFVIDEIEYDHSTLRGRTDATRVHLRDARVPLEDLVVTLLAADSLGCIHPILWSKISFGMNTIVGNHYVSGTLKEALTPLRTSVHVRRATGGGMATTPTQFLNHPCLKLILSQHPRKKGEYDGRYHMRLFCTSEKFACAYAVAISDFKVMFNAVPICFPGDLEAQFKTLMQSSPSESRREYMIKMGVST